MAKIAEGKKPVEKLKKQLTAITFLPVGSVFDYKGHRYVITIAGRQFVDAQRDGRVRPGGNGYAISAPVMVEWVMSTEGLDGKKYVEKGQQSMVFASKEIKGVTDSMSRVEDAIKTLKGDVRAIARDMMAKKKSAPERERKLEQREKKPRGRKAKSIPETYHHSDDDIPF